MANIFQKPLILSKQEHTHKTFFLNPININDWCHSHLMKQKALLVTYFISHQYWMICMTLNATAHHMYFLAANTKKDWFHLVILLAHKTCLYCFQVSRVNVYMYSKGKVQMTKEKCILKKALRLKRKGGGHTEIPMNLSPSWEKVKYHTYLKCCHNITPFSCFLEI